MKALIILMSVLISATSLADTIVSCTSENFEIHIIKDQEHYRAIFSLNGKIETVEEGISAQNVNAGPELTGLKSFIRDTGLSFIGIEVATQYRITEMVSVTIMSDGNGPSAAQIFQVGSEVGRCL